MYAMPSSPYVQGTSVSELSHVDFAATFALHNAHSLWYMHGPHLRPPADFCANGLNWDSGAQCLQELQLSLAASLGYILYFYGSVDVAKPVGDSPGQT